MKYKFISALIMSLPVILLSYLLFMNTVPFDIHQEFIGIDGNNISKLGPSNRVSLASAGIYRAHESPIYFSSKLTQPFTDAEVDILFKNPNQEILSLGYKDQQEWHYASRVISAPFLDRLEWPTVSEDGLTLHQRQQTYKDVLSFIKDAPVNKTIGLFGIDDSVLIDDDLVIANYTPSETGTKIESSLRGNLTMYTYLHNEPFTLDIAKRDLNWYDGPDPIKITISKEDDIVMKATIADDGNSTSDNVAGGVQTVKLKNPGPDLPESGVYKIRVESSGDALITNISTNLRKLVFTGQLYVASNAKVFGQDISQTQASTLFTNLKKGTVEPVHANGSNKVIFNESAIDLTLNNPSPIHSVQDLSTLVIPEGDVRINGIGYFAFNQDQFFLPSKYHSIEIGNEEELENVDYILTSYTSPLVIDGWYRSLKRYDLTNAFITDKKLSWAITTSSPRDKIYTFDVRDINIRYSRSGWIR